MITTKLKIRLYGDPCLRKKSVPVKEVGPSERLLINSMIAAMHHAKGVGLAAPQVGIHQRILVVDIGDGPIAVINPRILKKSGKQELEEGCLSIPEVTVNITRPQKIVVKYMDENNHVHKKACEDILARVILHESDHLDGKLIIDYASDEEKAEFQDQLKLMEQEYKK